MVVAEAFLVLVEEGALSSKVSTTNTQIQTRKNFTIHQVKSSCGTP